MGRARFGVLVVAIVAVAAACRGGGGSATVERTTPTTHTTVVRTPNGVAVRFSVAKSSPMLTRFRVRHAILVADEQANGQPPPPDFCRPAESFAGTLSIGGRHYDLSGAADRGSANAVRIFQSGSSTRFVYVLAKAFRPVRLPLTVDLDRPVFTGPMTALGDGWYVAAAPVGSAAPWYVHGAIREAGSGSSEAIATIPETRSGVC